MKALLVEEEVDALRKCQSVDENGRSSVTFQIVIEHMPKTESEERS